jgi:NADH-quinone oxidoreductase subunit N
LGSVIGLYYYLRVVVEMAMPVSTVRPAAPKFRVPFFDKVVIAGLLVLLVSLGTYPAPMIALIQATVGH